MTLITDDEARELVEYMAGQWIDRRYVHLRALIARLLRDRKDPDA